MLYIFYEIYVDISSREFLYEYALAISSVLYPREEDHAIISCSNSYIISK